MTPLAEIADKTPSAVEVLAATGMIAAVAASICMIGRKVAWTVLAVTAAAGVLWVGTVVWDDPMWAEGRDELGWPWAVANVVGPMLPAAAAAVVIVCRRKASVGGGFPVVNKPARTP